MVSWIHKAIISCPRKQKTRPTSIQLVRHRRTASQSGRPESRSGRRRASWSVGPTSEVHLQSEDSGGGRPIRGERSTSNFLVSLDPRTYRETRSHAESVLGTTSNDYATTTTSSRAGRTRGRESRRSRQTRSPSRKVGLGDRRAHRFRQERFQVEQPRHGDTLYDGDGMAASYRRPPSKTRMAERLQWFKWPSR